MEQLYNGFTLEIPSGAFPLSTDSMILADFAKLPRQASVLDLGSGCAALGTLLCAKDPRCTVTGIEVDPAAHQAALDNIRRNGLQDRLFSICGDLTSIPLEAGAFHCCISNPPYFSGGPESAATPLARKEAACTLEALTRTAARSIRYGGDFFVVYRPERLAELIACTSRYQLEPKRLRLVRHQPDSPVSLVLLACRKGGKPGLQWEELCLFDRDGSPTPAYQEIYHL